MAFTLTIDGYDLSPFLRVNPEDGFDPQDADLIEPGFGPNSGDDGSPLLSVQAGNREMAFPVHLTPKATANYPDTKQGLHDLLRDINGLLKNCKLLVWQDEDATNPTTYDVVFARFEPEYNFRRAQVLYVTGIVRIWVKPYGHTGTYRALGSAVGTGLGVAVTVPAGSVVGDVDAQLEVTITTGSYAIGKARAFGYAIVPSGYVWDIPVASILNYGPMASIQDPVGLGSYSMDVDTTLTSVYAEVFGNDVTYAPFGAVRLSPATMYAGANRVLAVVKGGGVAIQALIDANTFGPKGFASVTMGGHNVVDLGVLNVSPQLGQATITMEIKVADVLPNSDMAYDVGNWPLQIQRLLVFPNNKLVVSLDNGDRTPLVEESFMRRLHAQASRMEIGELNVLGPAWDYIPSYSYLGWRTGQDFGIKIASSAVQTTAAGFFNIEGRDMEVNVAFQQTRGMPSVAVLAYRTYDDEFTSGKGNFAQLHQVNGSQSALSLWAATQTWGFLGGSVGGFPTPTEGILTLRACNYLGQAEVRNRLGSIVATCQASHSTWQVFGRPGCGIAAGSHGASVQIDGMRAETFASRAIGPRDRIVFNSAVFGAVALNNASVFQRAGLESRGDMPKLSPTLPQSIVAFQLPMAVEQRAADIIDVNVRVQERFRYAR